MGLDMYLLLDKGRKGSKEVAKVLESAEFWDNKRKNGDKFDGLILAQWRKAFGILNWFDNNLESVKTQTINPKFKDREGTQNYTYYKVGYEEFVKLLVLSRQILKEAQEDEPNIPEDLYPVGEHFFIGGYSGINEWWWSDIEDTVAMLQEAEKHIDWNEDDVYFLISY